MRRRLRILFSFISVFVLYTAYKIAQLWPSHPFAATAISFILFFLMLSGTFIYRGNAEVYDKPWFRVVSWFGSLALGLWATFFILSIPVDLLDLVVFVSGKIAPSIELGAEERSRFVEIIYFALIVLSGAFAVIGYFEILRGARARETEIPIEGLASALDGFKIAQITDLHVGATIRAGYVRQVVERTNALNPDVIVLTGDIIDGHPSSVAEHVKPLSGLKAKYGVYYVTGNHEYFWGADEIVRLLSAQGIRALMNENEIIDVNDANVMIAGVADSRPNIAKALASNVATAFKLFLVHKPAVHPTTEALGANLQLAGHTHAGQFFPFSLFIGFAHKYSRGLYRHNEMWVYVNPGTGYWGPANRFTVAPEISLLALRPRK